MKTLLGRLFGEKGFAWYGFCQFLTIVFFVVFFRYRAFGRENVPSRGGALLASNHQSFFDPVLIGLLLNRRINQLARSTLFRNPVFARLIRSLGSIPIERGKGDKEALGKGIEVLRSGGLLVVFPEGTRTSDGEIGDLMPGIFLMARRAGAPIIPVVIEGAFRAWPRHRKLFSAFRGIKVAFGRPLVPGKGLEVRDAVKESMVGLMGMLRRVSS